MMSDGLHDIHQVELATPPLSNAAFWERLRAEYEAKRLPLQESPF
jgi:hypothetical protein